MKLLIFRAEDSEAVKGFLLETLLRSKDYPMNAIFTLRFKAVALEGLGVDLLYLLVLETTLFNLLPSAFFRRMIVKGLKKRGYSGRVAWVKPKAAVLLLGGLE